MRKGFTLVEIMLVLLIISALSVPMAKLSTITLRDIPAVWKIIESNTSVLDALKKIQKDVNIARGFPKSFADYTADSNTLLIDLEDDVICYQLKDNKILRRKLARTDAGGIGETVTWPIPWAKIEWNLRQKDGKYYAVEVQSHIERNTAGILRKKMKNSHVYFVGAYREAAK